MIRSAGLGLSICLSVALTNKVVAQDAEKTKAEIMYQMMDLDYRFALVPANKDSACRMYFAQQAKAEFSSFKKLLEPNLALFKPGQQTRLTNLQKAYEELFSPDIFNTLKKPDYRLSKSVEDDEAAKRLSDGIHKMSRNLLIDNLENIDNLDLVLTLSQLTVAADVTIQRNNPSSCIVATSKQMEQGNALLDKYYQAGRARNPLPLNTEIEQLLLAFKNKSNGIPQQTLALYGNGILKLTPSGKVAAKEANKASREEFLKKEIHLKMLYPTTKVYLTGKIKPLLETEKYTLQLPSEGQSFEGRQGLFFNTDAKEAKKKDIADYTFTVIAPGVRNVTIDPPIFLSGRVKANVMYSPEVTVRGYVANIRYHYPVKIEVRNKEGQLEKTLILIDEQEELTSTYHADYLRAPKFEERSPVTTIHPFYSADSAAKSISFQRDMILRRLQVNSWAETTPLLSKALTAAYGSEKVSNAMYPIYGIKDPQPEYADLVTLVEKTKEAISNIGSKDKTAASIADLKNIIQDYEQRLRGDLTPNMRALCLINAAQSALMTDEISKSVAFYKAYLAVEKDNEGIQSSYEGALTNFYYRGLLDDVKSNPVMLGAMPKTWK